MNNVITPPFNRGRLGELAKRIEELIYQYADRVSLAEVVGVLEIVKMNVLEKQK